MLQTTYQQEQKNTNQEYSFYLDHIIDSSGSKLSGEASYTDFKKMHNENSITENKETQNGFDLSSDNDQRVKLFYASLDIELNKKFADYSFGLQYNDSKSENMANYTNPDLADQNSLFNYNETTYSAYFSGSKEFDEKWSLKLGLRSEYTNSKGNSITLSQITKRNYFELFPTAYLGYKANTDNNFTLSYGRRIDRPPYRNLDPFRQYVSQYSYSEGNPYLRPAYNNNFELKHLYKNKLSSALYFSYIPNGYSDIEVVSEDSHYIANEYDNYLKTYKFGITESYEWIPFSWWESNNTAQAYYSKSTSNNPNTLDKLSGFGAYFQTNNNLQLNKKKTLRANLSFTYYTPEVNGVYNDKTYYFLDLGITALFFDEDLTLTLSADDIFKSAIYKRTSNINGISQYFEGYYGSRSINFSASYKFGNSKNQNEREVYDENKERID